MKQLLATATEKKNEAGDSDSDDEDKEARLPRSLLSPVPGDQLTTIVVFGADGNLAETKLLPTLYELWHRSLLPNDVLIIGYARPKASGGKHNDTADFRKALLERLPDVHRRHSHRHHGQGGSRRPSEEEEAGGGEADDPRMRFVLRCHYATGLFDAPHSMRTLLDLLDGEERRRWHARKHGSRWLKLARRRRGAENGRPFAPEPDETPALPPPQAVRMYYMSVPPFLYAGICSSLKAAKQLPSGGDGSRHGGRSIMSRGGPGGPEERCALALLPRRFEMRNGPWSLLLPPSADAFDALRIRTRRYILEKPFGRDYDSCSTLIAELSMLKRSESFYIDHYLGKELVMNLLVLRFANVCFGAVWNRQHIKSVQVIFKEKVHARGRKLEGALIAMPCHGAVLWALAVL